MKMPSKRRKYNARFPAGRIKKIMQTDEQVGKVAQAVPIIISRTLELFTQSLLKSALAITNAKNARTLSPSHLKQCVVADPRFHFLKDLVRSLPDMNSFDEDVAPSVSSSTVSQDPLSSFSGRKYKPGQQAKQVECSDERNNLEKDSEESDSSDTEKEASLDMEENTSDFVIDEDYGC